MTSAELIFLFYKLVNEAVDEVRRIEQQRNRVFKNTRYIWLKNPSALVVGLIRSYISTNRTIGINVIEGIASAFHNIP